MRSIGKWNIKKLQRIVDEEMSKPGDYRQAKDEIMAQVPEEWFEIWEMAYSEIYRLVNDMMFHYKGVKK